ncbi:MAG: ABC transporter ATP-binding protein, partial [Acidimicrobiia bacterium]|nr:ABC transporter ATP-binding protein [Acidimicrobiia bacterium]
MGSERSCLLTSSEAILTVRSVRKAFGGVVAVNVERLGVEPGRITSLIGPNGAGKTTLFDIVTGFVAADGEILFNGLPIHGKPTHAIARQGLVRTFQLTRALGRMSVLENMMLASPDQPAERLGGLVRSAFKVRELETEVRARAGELLERFNLTHLSDEYAGRLSGGQKKLLELARALMNRPRMVLLDEPMAGVNPALGEQLLSYVQELRDEGMTFLLVEHDMDVIM